MKIQTVISSSMLIAFLIATPVAAENFDMKGSVSVEHRMNMRDFFENKRSEFQEKRKGLHMEWKNRTDFEWKKFGDVKKMSIRRLGDALENNFTVWLEKLENINDRIDARIEILADADINVTAAEKLLDTAEDKRDIAVSENAEFSVLIDEAIEDGITEETRKEIIEQMKEVKNAIKEAYSAYRAVIVEIKTIEK